MTHAAEIVGQLQEHACTAVAALEHDATFVTDDWSADSGALRGRGSTRVLAGGRVFEKGGVNTSSDRSSKATASLLPASAS
jgi:coproporphyrinogen III oxidase